MWEPLLGQIARDQDFFDEQCARLLESVRERGTPIYCTRGCSNCCTLAVNSVFSEALSVAPQLSATQQAAVANHAARLLDNARAATDFKDFLRKNRKEAGYCPLLETQGDCGIYRQRPFSCRALFSTRNNQWCAVDFSTLHPAEKEAFMSSLDTSIVAFPTHYLASPQRSGARWEKQAMDAMRSRFGFSLSGNFVFMLFVERHLALSRLIPQGLETTRAALREAGFDLPYLIHCEPAQAADSP